MKEKMTQAEEIKYYLFEDGLVTGKRYHEREKFWEDKGLWHSGYKPETEQVYLKMKLYKGEGDNLEQTISTLEEILPHIKAIDGVKVFGVFEHTLSENGVYCVEITEHTYTLVICRYRRKSVVKECKSLREMIEYIQEHHYYESSEDKDEE